MIEPYVSEKQCKTCSACKPVTEFYRRDDAAGGYQPNCKQCTSNREARRYHARKEAGRIRSREPRVEPLWPLPTYTLTDSLDCIRLRKWRGPVSTEPMRASL